MSKTIHNISLNHKIPKRFLEVASFIKNALKKNNFESYLVGGSVRDLLLEKRIKDIDFTTNAHPKQVMKIFRNVIPVGIDFGTVIVVHNKIPVEITTFREDMEYIDGRHPTQIKFGSSLLEDVKRRDFTINGLAYDLEKELIYDYVDGLIDIERKIIRTIGNPIERFTEDGLRPIRGFRFASSLNFQIEEETFLASTKTLSISRKVAKERFFDEWRKTLKQERKDIFWKLIIDSGMSKSFFTSLSIISNDNVKTDFLYSLLKKVKPKNMGMYSAYLLILFFIKSNKSENSFQLLSGNEQLSQLEMAKQFLKENKFPAKEKKLAMNLLQSPLLQYLNQEKFILENNTETEEFKIQFKKKISYIKKEEIFFHFRFLFDLLENFYLKNKYQKVQDIKRKITSQYHSIINNKEAIYISDIDITGHDLIELGYQKKQIGDKLIQLLEHVHKFPNDNKKEILMRL